jgi:DNA primase
VIRHFDRSLLPIPAEFYRKEIGSLTRPNRKSWALGNCPFHESKSKKSFSVHLRDGGFICLGCGERG